MTEIKKNRNLKLLDLINDACIEILQVLSDTFESTANAQYKEDINKDMVTLVNLKHIVTAVKKDIESETVGASTELLLRIAANDFNNKLALIPEKKTLRNEITNSLIEVHSNLLRQTVKRH